MVAAGLPRQVLAFAGGYAFGAPLGAAISLVGQLLGCVLDYVAARGLAAGLVRRLLARPAGQRVQRLLAVHPFTATLTLRLLPVSNNVMLNVLAGAARLKPSAFFGAHAAGVFAADDCFCVAGERDAGGARHAVGDWRGVVRGGFCVGGRALSADAAVRKFFFFEKKKQKTFAT